MDALYGIHDLKFRKINENNAEQQARFPFERRLCMIDARLSPHVSKKARQLPVRQQAAALCYRFDHGRSEVLLVTTRKSGRWIFPKGWLIEGLTPSETAQQEAWEEAGIRGKCDARPMGRFQYQKRHRKDGSVLCVVDVFPLLATSFLSRFPECGQRKRKWVTPKKATQLVNSPELALLLRKLEPARHWDAFQGA